MKKFVCFNKMSYLCTQYKPKTQNAYRKIVTSITKERTK